MGLATTIQIRISATLQLQPIQGVSFYRILQSASWYCLSASMLQYSFSKWSKECLPRLRRRAAWWVSNMFTKYRPKSFCSHSTSESAPWRTLKSKTNWEWYEERFHSRLAALWFCIHVTMTRFLFSLFFTVKCRTTKWVHLASNSPLTSRKQAHEQTMMKQSQWTKTEIRVCF